jgi:hypothetical protein
VENKIGENLNLKKRKIEILNGRTKSQLDLKDKSQDRLQICIRKPILPLNRSKSRKGVRWVLEIQIPPFSELVSTFELNLV